MVKNSYLLVALGLFLVMGNSHAKQKNGGSQKYETEILQVLGETIAVPASTFMGKEHKYSLPADVSFMFVDLKYIKGKIKICEFGPGNTAGAHKNKTPLQFFNEKIYLRAPYWSFLWPYLASLKLPVWFVGKDPEKASSKWLRAKTVHWDIYKKLGGYYARDMNGLEQSDAFKKALSKTTDFDISKLGSYRGVVLFRTTKHNYKKKIRKFKLKYPQFIVIDEHTFKYSFSKIQGARVFSNFGLEQYRPKWGRFSSVYSNNLASNINRKINSEFLVIKPPDANQSSGVILTPKTKLDKMLRFILSPKRAHSHTYSYWKKKNIAKYFLVEEYCPSKKIKVRGKWYDPTMRLFFILRCDDQKLYITVTGGFWKIPNENLESKASLTDKHVTIHGGSRRIGLPIAPSDLLDARVLLQQALPGLYFNMLK